jgi:hypothetical protein
MINRIEFTCMFSGYIFSNKYHWNSSNSFRDEIYESENKLRQIDSPVCVHFSYFIKRTDKIL